ncbi:MAG: phage tail sheath family protein, partial [Armatimonadota bacterium]
MPVTPTYPGVYIEEIPSGVRTITGVSTSIAAFIGWASRGPVDRAQRILSWQDYERYYGGLDRRSLLGYAVSQFFANGGQDAYVIRLVAEPPDPSPASTASVAIGDLTLTAKDPGGWAARYGIATRRRTDDPAVTDRFRVQVVFFETPTSPEIVVESFENLSMSSGDRRFVGSVVNAES